MFVKIASSAFSGAGFDYLDYSDNGIDLEIGDLVSVPFNNRLVVGYVINKSDKKSVNDVLPVYEKIENGNSLNKDLVDLAFYISKNYMCPLSRVILSIIPSMLTSKVKTYYFISNFDINIITPKENEIIERLKNNNGVISKLDEAEKRILRSLVKKEIITKKFKIDATDTKPKMLKSVAVNSNFSYNLTDKQKILIDYLKDKNYIPINFLTKNKIASKAIIDLLIQKNVLNSEYIREDRIPSFTYVTPSKVELTKDQESAFNGVKNSIDNNFNDTFLLFGVTASGKTEVYIRLIEEVIKKQKTALILLPEIALTTQVMNIFKSRFGKLVAVLHSALSKGERLDEWDRIKNGNAKIVLGARSAIFAPLKNIGIIIIDEEHDGGYKQDVSPKYNAKDLALYRAKKSNGVCVFGSATPSVESFYKAKIGEYKLINMPNRVSGRKLPNVTLADLKTCKQDVIITPILHEKIQDRLNKKEQIILLQNRRAYSTYVMCSDCAWVAKCKNCDVSLKYHFKSDMLVCHHCGYAIKRPMECPDCHSKYLKAYGTGTQKVEEYIKFNFPNARILRMDRDTTANKNSHSEILNAFRNKEADILVGTQMVAKGLDFPNVTLVGVINADIDLNMPDFRSGERTFQLVNQVTGRAGRGKVEGEVIIQTYNPDHEILTFAKNQDYIGLYKKEEKSRKILKYPPFVRIIKGSVTGDKMDDVKNILSHFHKDLCAINTENEKMIVYEPLPAIVPKINQIYRANILIKTSDIDYSREKIISLLSINRLYKQKIIFDIDPMFMD